MEKETPTNSTTNTGKTPAGPVHCKQCLTFYANASLDGLCSGCFKKSGKELPASGNKKAEKQKEEKPVEEEKPVCKQKNHKFCWDCKKKVGYFGYKCKCLYTYCGFHRLPEDHECTFDHAGEGRKRLDLNNPALVHNKINKI